MSERDKEENPPDLRDALTAFLTLALERDAIGEKVFTSVATMATLPMGRAAF